MKNTTIEQSIWKTRIAKTDNVIFFFSYYLLHNEPNIFIYNWEEAETYSMVTPVILIKVYIYSINYSYYTHMI